MSYYFEDYKAIYGQSHGDIENTLSVMAGRYIGENPENKYTARPFSNYGLKRNKDYRYEFHGNDIFPDAKEFSYAYLWGKIKREGAGSLRFVMIPYGPFKIWMNGKEVYASTFESERYDDNAITIDLPIEKGWNHLIIRFTKTKTGFGGEFGTWLGKLDYYFMHGLKSLEEMEGFDYTAPTCEHYTNFPNSEDNECPAFASKIVSTPKWTDKQLALGSIARIFSGVNITGKKILARTRFTTYYPENVSIKVLGNADASLYIDGKSVNSVLELKAGLHQFLAVINVASTYKSDDKLDFNIELVGKDGKIELENPFLVDNKELPWIFAGPLSNVPEIAIKQLDEDSLVGEKDEKTWWRIDIPAGWIRLYNENALFGHWDYPLGVTLYGLIETARLFAKEGKVDTIGTYVENHVKKAVATFEYALFDKANFGGATAVHHLLSSIDSLDDCGSFGSLMLEVAKDRNIGDYSYIANYVGEYITKHQSRLEDGCFYRKQMMHKFHNGTMWADDLYMSIPFLCRYAAFTKDTSILDDAANQFIGFKKKLFMPEQKLMAHVYDFRRDMNTGVPWGRGNGWTIFSLTELLSVLPENHPKRAELLKFYNELAEGFLAVQTEDGMWHQVLNMIDSYPESSCTSMFICAYSRGIRNGWLEGDTDKYRKACAKAWSALERIAIDKAGNLYGVCRGSEFAFNPRYYSEHLLPQLNNTHGIGITLLAGVEMCRLNEYQK